MLPPTSVPHPRCFAVTGGIACGKSFFADLLSPLGAEVLDTDEVTHRLESPGGLAVAPIREAFGPGMVDSNGGINRQALADCVFGRSAARARLNAILHPLIDAEVRSWRSRPGRPETIRLVLAPLLFECGWDRGRDWDGIVCIGSSAEVQVARLMQKRGLSEEAARQRLASQMSVADKAARSDYVIWNNTTPEAFARSARDWWEQVNQAGRRAGNRD